MTTAHPIRPNEPVDVLRHNSKTHIAQLNSGRVEDVLFISRHPMQALGALTRAAYGRECRLRHASDILQACDLIAEATPDLLVLDVTQVPNDAAKSSVARLRRFDYGGPVVAISNDMSRLRRRELMDMGAVDGLDYDDLSVAVLIEVTLAGAEENRERSTRAGAVGGSA